MRRGHLHFRYFFRWAIFALKLTLSGGPGTFDEKYKGKIRYLVYSSSKSDREKYREAVEKWNRIKAEVDARKYDAEKEARESEKKRLESVTKTGESKNRKYNLRLVKTAIRKYGVSRTRH